MQREGQNPSSPAETIEKLASRMVATQSRCPGRHSGWREYERRFSALLALLAPRIARLIRQYGLTDMCQDARQAAAIGVHRALAGFDPARASFSTHVTWQIRGELQSLRHRVRLDQRRSAVNAGATTVSLDALSDGEGGSVEIVDEASLARTESDASDLLARGVMQRLLDRLSAPDHERAILLAYLFENTPRREDTSQRTAEQRRQIVRRTMRNCAKIAPDPRPAP